MAKPTKNTESQYIAGVKHSAWEAAQKAGVLTFGRVRVGGVMGARKSKAAANKAACRGRASADE